MELCLFKPVHLSRTSIVAELSAGRNLEPHRNNQLQNIQFRKLSNKDLSRILRTEAAIKAIEKKANSSKYNNLWPKAVLEALTDAIKQNRWESALKIFDLLRQQRWYEARSQTYTKLLVMLGKCNQPNHASLLFENMLRDGIQPTVDVSTALVGAFALNGRFDEAFSIVEDMKSIGNCRPDAFTYSILIKSCVKQNRLDMIGQVLKEMSLAGVECNAVTYNTMIDGYGKSKLFELMEDTLTDMIQSGDCTPDIFTFNSVIGAYGGSQKIEEMEKWFTEFQLMGLEPDIMSYNILIKSYGNCGLYQKMGTVMDFMEKRFISPSTVTYNIVIETFGKSGDIEKMDEMFLKMKHQGVKPNSITYTSLVCAYGKVGCLEKVDSVLRQVESSNVVLDTAFFNCTINVFGNAGDMERMMEIFMAMEGCRCTPDDITFATMIQACRAHGMIDVAKNLERYMNRELECEKVHVPQGKNVYLDNE